MKTETKTTDPAVILTENEKIVANYFIKTQNFREQVTSFDQNMEKLELFIKPYYEIFQLVIKKSGTKKSTNLSIEVNNFKGDKAFDWIFNRFGLIASMVIMHHNLYEETIVKIESLEKECAAVNDFIKNNSIEKAKISKQLKKVEKSIVTFDKDFITGLNDIFIMCEKEITHLLEEYNKLNNKLT